MAASRCGVGWEEAGVLTREDTTGLELPRTVAQQLHGGGRGEERVGGRPPVGHGHRGDRPAVVDGEQDVAVLAALGVELGEALERGVIALASGADGEVCRGHGHSVRPLVT